MKTITIKKPGKMKVLTVDDFAAIGIKANPSDSVTRDYGKYPYSCYAIFDKIPGERGYYKAEKPMLLLHTYKSGMDKEKYLREIGKCIDEYEADIRVLFDEGEGK